jgi:hypothetical protein
MTLIGVTPESVLKQYIPPWMLRKYPPRFIEVRDKSHSLYTRSAGATVDPETRTVLVPDKRHEPSWVEKWKSGEIALHEYAHLIDLSIEKGSGLYSRKQGSPWDKVFLEHHKFHEGKPLIPSPREYWAWSFTQYVKAKKDPREYKIQWKWKNGKVVDVKPYYGSHEEMYRAWYPKMMKFWDDFFKGRKPR